MDLSLRRVLEALAPGPATPRILTNRYGMSVSEAEEALAEAIDQGYATGCGPIAFHLTQLGHAAADSELNPSNRDRARDTARRLEGRDLWLRDHD